MIFSHSVFYFAKSNMDVIKYKSVIVLTSKVLIHEILIVIIKFYTNIVMSFSSDILRNQFKDHGFDKMYKLNYISSNLSKFLILHCNHMRLHNLTAMERRSIYIFSEKYGFKAEKRIVGNIIECKMCEGSGRCYPNECSCCHSCITCTTCTRCKGRGVSRNAIVTDMILTK